MSKITYFRSKIPSGTKGHSPSTVVGPNPIIRHEEEPGWALRRRRGWKWGDECQPGTTLTLGRQQGQAIHRTTGFLIHRSVDAKDRPFDSQKSAVRLILFRLPVLLYQ